MDLQIQGGFPDRQSVAITAKDSSGCLEAIHTELVHQIYRRAVASDYTLQIAACTRTQSPQYSATMVRRYKAPYILSSYQPHFTLLTNVPQSEIDDMSHALRLQFENLTPNRRIKVDRLAIMSRDNPNRPWTIEQEIMLRKE